MKTDELTGAALDWAVAKCEGKDKDCEIHVGNVWYGRVTSGFIQYKPSTSWAQGGAIIERELISLECYFDRVEWCAWTPAPEQPTGESFAYGETPLIAAMRCYVASKLGDEVEIPEEPK